MFEKILKKIKPSKKEEEEIQNKVNTFLNKINSKLLHAKAIIGGSFAKGTWLKEQHDIDIFILFDKEQNMSARLEVAIKSFFPNCEKVHGSRDYFKLEYEGLNLELVPVLKIEFPEQATNITDISPMHIEYVKNNTNENLADEIRLTKYLLKANKLYGAETYIGGFSGYVVELLIIEYKSLINLTKNAAAWKYGKVIDIEENNKFESEQKFPLIIIDPVQPNRNAAAALTKEKFESFIELSKLFSKGPKDNFFEEIKINPKAYNLIFKVGPLKGSKDVVGTKMLKVFEKIQTELKNNEFELLDSDWEWTDHGYLYFKVKSKKLSSTMKHFGPPVNFIDDVNKFKEKHKGSKVKEEKGKLYVVLPRKIKNLRELFVELAKDPYIKEKVSSITMIK